MQSLPPLPANPVNFERPPVAEVALAVQWAEPATDDTMTLGRFWPVVRDRYPHVQPQPPLPSMSEEFGPRAGPTVSFQLLGAPPSGRYWLLNEDQTELIQVQPDRFAYNWRKQPAEVEYPRYEYLRERFFDLLSTFVETAEQSGQSPRPTWCEVTYINRIAPPGENGRRPDLSRVLRRVSPFTPSPLPKPEETNLAESFLLEREGQPVGRLHVTASSAFTVDDQTPIFLLTLVARGLATTPDVSGAMAFLDYGRNLIVTSFEEMTTDEMHELWEVTSDSG